MTRPQSKRELTATNEAIVADCNDKLSKLATSLSSLLQKEVFPEEERQVIKTIDVVTNMERLYCSVKEDGAVKTRAVTGKDYLRAIWELNIYGLDDIDDDVLSNQYKTLLNNLSSEPVRKLICALKDTSADAHVSVDIIKALLNSNTELYLGCEMICHTVIVSALKKGIESVVESMVSTYEHKFHKSRNVPDSAADMEMEISMNGPSLPNCQAVIQKAITEYFSDHRPKKDEKLAPYMP